MLIPYRRAGSCLAVSGSFQLIGNFAPYELKCSEWCDAAKTKKILKKIYVYYALEMLSLMPGVI